MKPVLGRSLPALLLAASLMFLSACAARPPAEIRHVPLSGEEIAGMQKTVAQLPVGERVAFWAGIFVGAPYDVDPLGAYVRSERLVCDSEIDCMYHVFRSVELATSDTPEGAEERALDLRFKTYGRLMHGRVLNYEERFDYAEDMVYSGKWGNDVTETLGEFQIIRGSRGREFVTYMPKSQLMKPENRARLRSGDLVFFIKDPNRRVVGEVVGHVGVLKLEDGMPFLIHASGSKSFEGRPGGGVVKKVNFLEYLSAMRFIGVMVTRFD